MSVTLMMRVMFIAVVIAGLGLAACGRKGPLELPPAAQAKDQTPGADGARPETPPAMDEYGRPIAPRGEKKPFILDGLLN